MVFLHSLIQSFKILKIWQKLALVALFLVVFLGTATATYLHGQYQNIVVTPTPAVDAKPTQPSPDPLRPISILLMGYGGGNHQGGKLTDTMMVAFIQPRQKTLHLISLPRDLWVKLPIVEGKDPSGWKMNAAYALGSDDLSYRSKPVQFTGEAGGGELAKFAAKQATGLEIDYFVTLNFASFRRSIDVLNGVAIRVDRTFDDYLYPIEGEENNTCGRSEEEMVVVTATLSAEKAESLFTCRYEHLHFDKGIVRMDGETALKFVRSRHSTQDGNDFGRAARQRSLLVAVREKILVVNFLPKALPFISTLATDLQTDITLSKMQEFLNFQNEISNYTIVSVPLTNENVFKFGRSSSGQFIVLPNEGEDQWSQVHEFVQAALASSNDVGASPVATASGQKAP